MAFSDAFAATHQTIAGAEAARRTHDLNVQKDLTDRLSKSLDDTIMALEGTITNALSSGKSISDPGIQGLVSQLEKVILDSANNAASQGLPIDPQSYAARIAKIRTTPTLTEKATATGRAEGAGLTAKAGGIAETSSVPLQQAEIAVGVRPKPEGEDSALQQKLRLLIESGAPEEIAKGIVSGRFSVSVDPQTGERQVIDIVTGKKVGGEKEIPKIDPENIDAFLPEGVDASQITGMSGFFKNIVNTVSDSIGIGLTTPKAEDAKQALNDLQVLTMSLLQAEVPGRPSNFLLQRLELLTVTPNSLLQGEERAIRRLSQTKRLISQEIRRIDSEMEKPLRPVELQKMRINQGQLKGLETAYDTIIKGFGKGGKKAELEIPIEKMNLEDIENVNLSDLSDDQLNALKKRMQSLTK